MDSFEDLMRQLNEKAIRDAAALDPAFAEKVEADRKALRDHETMLEAQRRPGTHKQIPAEQQRKPEPDDEGPSEQEILKRVNAAVIERREL